MAKPLLTDELWEVIEPLLPPEPPKPRGGRPRISNRAALTGILFVLRTGLQWEMLPQEMGCGSGMTCWRRLRDWQAAGVWEKLHQVLLDKLNALGEIDWWVVERTFAWLNHFRRLTIRYERRLDMHRAFLELGCALVCFNFVQKRFC